MVMNTTQGAPMTTQAPADPKEQADFARPKVVALYASDIADVERVRSHFGLDSFSQAIRRAIRIAMQTLPDPDQSERGAA